ncbi:hypothetical protein GCM10017044_27630 [Kordiimonas sediminis]|uniref:DUF2065 domain-containing protein n=1 Tax=Kordiimonas sediminis TaxID=1735581 RepID=A0A919AZH5_9PROT|nr:DUF2065 domain-containing protein [Kordiimonas sediminis]GHF30720.1 hypothetical protein GCM10017044_27630 [Kordiimonas sediminis]
MSFELIVTAIGLAFFIEGAAYALFPDGMKRLLVAALEQSAANLRVTGLTIAAIGVAIIWLVQ